MCRRTPCAVDKEFWNKTDRVSPAGWIPALATEHWANYLTSLSFIYLIFKKKNQKKSKLIQSLWGLAVFTDLSSTDFLGLKPLPWAKPHECNTNCRIWEEMRAGQRLILSNIQPGCRFALAPSHTTKVHVWWVQVNCLKVPTKVEPVGKAVSAERLSRRTRGSDTGKGVLVASKCGSPVPSLSDVKQQGCHFNSIWRNLIYTLPQKYLCRYLF